VKEGKAFVTYVDDALDAGLLHGLAGRRLVHVLVVLPPALIDAKLNKLIIITPIQIQQVTVIKRVERQSIDIQHYTS